MRDTCNLRTPCFLAVAWGCVGRLVGSVGRMRIESIEVV